MAGGNGHVTPAAGSTAYVEQHAALLSRRGAGGAASDPADRALETVRRAAIERFAALGVPTLRDEEWRLTDVGVVAERPFTPAEQAAGAAGGSRVTAADVARWLVPGAVHLVVVNGAFRADLSSAAAERGVDGPGGLRAGGLAEALRTRPDAVLAHFDRTVEAGANPFAVLNTAFTFDGAHVYVPRGIAADRPVQILYLTSADAAERTASFGRGLVVLGESAQATVIETFVGPSGVEYLACPVTDVVVGPNASLDHYRVQEEGDGAIHLGAQHVRMMRDSVLVSHNIALGGSLARSDVRAKLAEEGVDCTLNGMYIGSRRQHFDTHMWVEHVMALGSSHELYKGILDDEARAVFNGRIYVHQAAQKTDAKQSNRNLLLSTAALVNSNPQLEIFADDVKCTHGSTVGQLDDEALFYLRSRGLGLDAARSLLIYAFASDVLSGVRHDAIRRTIETALVDRLPSGDIVRELA